MLDTIFAVTIKNQKKIVACDESVKQAFAIILIESLKAFVPMSHAEAVNAYTYATKSVGPDGMTIGSIDINVDNATENDDVSACDLYINAINDINEYWNVD